MSDLFKKLSDIGSVPTTDQNQYTMLAKEQQKDRRQYTELVNT